MELLLLLSFVLISVLIIPKFRYQVLGSKYEGQQLVKRLVVCYLLAFVVSVFLYWMASMFKNIMIILWISWNCGFAVMLSLEINNYFVWLLSKEDKKQRVRTIVFVLFFIVYIMSIVFFLQANSRGSMLDTLFNWLGTFIVRVVVVPAELTYIFLFLIMFKTFVISVIMLIRQSISDYRERRKHD